MSNLPYTQEELDAGMIELGKAINKQNVYLKEQCRTKPCLVNMCRYNMCYGIEKTFRKSQQGAGIQREGISNKDIFKIIKKAVAKQSPRIIEKYTSNETKHLERIKKERQLRLKQAKINYRHMFAPENNIPKPKPLLIKLETVDDLELGANEDVVILKKENVDSESFSQNSSVEAILQTIPNINQFNSMPRTESMYLDHEVHPIREHFNKSIEEGTAPLNYNAFGSGVITSTQKDGNEDICNVIPDTFNSQFPCTEEFATQESYSFSTESILNDLKHTYFMKN